MVYIPRPVDTSAVTLAGSSFELVEILAKNNHDVWAAQRKAEGWTYGERRNDDLKTNPCLVEYSELPDSEKEYDRKMAIATWKLLLAHGYRIDPPKDPWESLDPESEQTVARLFEQLQPGSTVEPSALLEEWRLRERDKRRWALHPGLYALMSRRMLQVGEPDIAYDIATEGLNILRGNPELLRWQALSLINTGAARRAYRLLMNLREAGNEDPETFGFLAFAAMELAQQAHPDRRRGYLEEAVCEFQKACGSVDRDFLFKTGAAVGAKLLGQDEDAARFAREAQAACSVAEAGLPPEDSDHYWIQTNLAESALVLGEIDEAVARYQRARTLARRRFGVISLAYRAADLLLRHVHPEHRARVQACFDLPHVVVFTGHAFDQAGRSDPRLPAALETEVRDAISRRLQSYGDVIGYSSAGAGADLLFLDTLQQRGGDAHVVLPYHPDQFFADSSSAAQGNGQLRLRQLFDRVLSNAVEVITLSPQQLRWGSVSYDYANRVLLGLADLHARQLRSELKPLAVWDGRPGTGPGDTAAVVQLWTETRRPYEIINLSQLLKLPRKIALSTNGSEAAGTAENIPHLPGAFTPASQSATSIKALLFADVHGFSKLNEEQLPLFVEHYLGQISELAATSPHRPITSRTTGDGLFLVFNTCREAGLFALELTSLSASSWSRFGLPESLGIRVAVHAGPVYACVDPITSLYNYTGQHVSHTARLEPVTPLNEVYATREFAALACVEGVTRFACDYVGKIPLAKNYGTFPAYSVRRVFEGAG